MEDVRCSRVLFTQSQRKVVADLMPILIEPMNLDEKNSRLKSFTANERLALIGALEEELQQIT